MPAVGTTYNVDSAYKPSVAPTNPAGALKSDDFINLLITQLQHQDPLQPMKNEDLLQQVSQIGSLQSQTELTTSLKDMVLQNQLTAASSMIGKSVAGTDEDGAVLTGVVASVKVRDKAVLLQLDTGKEIDMTHVTGVTSTSPTVAQPG